MFGLQRAQHHEEPADTRRLLDYQLSSPPHTTIHGLSYGSVGSQFLSNDGCEYFPGRWIGTLLDDLDILSLRDPVFATLYTFEELVAVDGVLSWRHHERISLQGLIEAVRIWDTHPSFGKCDLLHGLLAVKVGIIITPAAAS